MTLARRRLARQAVTRPAPGPALPLGAGPLAVVERLLAVQAQDPGAALWAVGSRCAGEVRAADVAAATEGGGIVRTWPMRGTLHLVPAVEARWLLELLTPRVIAATAARYRQVDLDEAAIARGRAVVERALGTGPKTRDELFAALEAAGERCGDQRGYHVVVRLAQDRCIVQVGADRVARFAPFDDVVPPADPVPRDEALARLAARYFAGHGPATEADLAWWAGLPLGEVRRGIAGAGDALVREEIDGTAHWSGADDLDAGAADEDAGVHLLPAFDEFLLGYRDRRATLDPAHADRIVPGGNGVFRPTVTVDGRTVGTWRARRPKRGPVIVDVEGFDGPLAEEITAASAERYARFVG